MTDKNRNRKQNLMNQINAGWDKFQDYIGTLTPEQLTGPTDAAGWTVKDHIIHLAVWEDSVRAMLQGKDRAAEMGLDHDTWASGDYDRQNEVIRQRHQDVPLEDVLSTFRDVHARLLEKLNELTDHDLLRPYNYWQRESTSERPTIDVIVSNTHEHYAEHIPWIEAIVRGK